MTVGITYDAGMLIAIDRNDRAAWALHRRAMVRRARLTVPAGVLGQAWRGGPQPLLSRMLDGCMVAPLDEVGARSVGAACALSATSDIVDASVVVGALIRGDLVVTSDESDIDCVAQALGRTVPIERI